MTGFKVLTPNSPGLNHLWDVEVSPHTRICCISTIRAIIKKFHSTGNVVNQNRRQCVSTLSKHTEKRMVWVAKKSLRITPGKLQKICVSWGHKFSKTTRSSTSLQIAWKGLKNVYHGHQEVAWEQIHQLHVLNLEYQFRGLWRSASYSRANSNVDIDKFNRINHDKYKHWMQVSYYSYLMSLVTSLLSKVPNQGHSESLAQLHL